MATTINASASSGLITTADTSTILQLQTGGTTALTVDASQNVGIGVTPSASTTAGTIYFPNNTTFGRYGYTQNSYFNGTNYIYSSSSQASLYQASSGQHIFYTAASGTAGNTISFTQAMTLTAAGNLALGNTTSLGSGANRVDLTLNGVSDGAIISFGNGGVRKGYLWNDGTDLVIANESTGVMRFLNSIERMRIDSSGNLLVGTTTTYATNSRVSIAVANGTSHGMTFRPDIAGSYRAVNFNNSTGGANVGYIDCTASATTYSTSSDYRLKENIAPMTGALAKVAQLNPVTYNWKVDGSDGQGFIAHELQAVVPDCVVGQKDAVETYTDEDGNEQTRPVYQGIDTSFLVATLTAAIQEQQAIIQTLTDRITALEGTTP
jgi:hypothetical protein